MESGTSIVQSSFNTQDFLPWWGGYKGLEQDYNTTSYCNYKARYQSSVNGNKRDPNPYSFSVVQNSGPFIFSYGKRADGYILRKRSGAFGHFSGFFEPDIPSNDTYNRCLEKFIEKYRGSVDLSVDIAEAGQTKAMLSATDQLLSFTKTLSKRFGPVKLASGLWLQYQYGWLPLLSTIHGLAEASLRVPVNALSRVRTRSRTEFSGPFACRIKDAYGSTRSVQVNGSGFHSTTISCTLSSLSSTDLASFTSLNPVSIAWELVPGSFIVDWVYDIGGYLRAAETAFLYRNNFVNGFVTEVSGYDVLLRDTSTSDGITTLLQGGRKFRSIRRSVLSSFPSPRAPLFKVDLGSSRMLSAAALLSNFLGKR